MNKIIVYKNAKKTNQRDVTTKQNKGDQPLLYATRWYFILITIKFHQDIPNGYLVTANRRLVCRKLKGHNLETKIKVTNILACHISP